MESHLSISSRQGFWRRNLVHCALAAVGGASDHKFNKHDGMEAVVFFTLLFSVLFLGLSPESVITLCSFSLSSTPPNWHWRQILLCRHPWRKYPAQRKNGMHYGMHAGAQFVYEGFTVSRSLLQKLKICEKIIDEEHENKMQVSFAIEGFCKMGFMD